ncbi:MAG: capsule assembly Wzi family protein [Lewinella sp.]|nr:capsule assembly Wzi family protein [Lewinella sp.]
MFNELITNDRGWWGNKWGLQLGLQYTNVLGIDQLDLRLEHNRARPYLFTHYDGSNSYTQFGMPLAHPLGANFAETLLHIRYRPLPRLTLDGRLYFIEQGEDDPANGLVFGENINAPSEIRPQEYGNTIGQGLHYNNQLLALEASYMLKHNLFLEGVFLHRNKAADQPERSSETTYLHLGLRLNVARRRDYF